MSSNPAPFSGALAHQSALLSGVHQHYFYDATTTLSVSTGDTLYTYVYLDPVNPPSEVTLQWNNGTWEHRAYWGANLIPWGDDGTDSRRYMGPLPATGQWVRLSVPAALVGLEATTLNGMAFTLYDGRATFDRAGKSTGTSSPTTTTLASSLNPANVGVSVTFTATVNGAAPTGTVSFTCRWQPVVQQRRLQRGLGQHQDRGVQQQYACRGQSQHRRHLLRRRRQPEFVQHPCTIARSQCQHRRHLVR